MYEKLAKCPILRKKIYLKESAADLYFYSLKFST